MAIPGLKPKVEVRAKVRIGEKKTTARGKEYPSSIDYFLSRDPLFAELVGARPNQLEIELVHDDAEDAFSTGLEWWRGKQLTCYSKGDFRALRVADQVTPDDTLLREGEVGNGRREITCLGRECPVFKRKDCKPMGRFVFSLAGRDEVWQIDTHSWGTIENLEWTLKRARRRGPLVGRTFRLSVVMKQKGTSKYPILTLQEIGAPMQVNTMEDVAKADALLPLCAAVLEGKPEAELRTELAGALDATNPGWRDNLAIVQRIKDIGVRASAVGLLRKYELAEGIES